MADQIVERRSIKTDRRKGGDRRKGPRRMSEVYPPPNSEEWKKILFSNIDDFANRYMISLSELGLLINELISLKEKHEYPQN